MISRLTAHLTTTVSFSSKMQPDLVLYRSGLWRWQHPGAADISLLIEISESSLTSDLERKTSALQECGNQGVLGHRFERQAAAVLCRADLQAPDIKRSHKPRSVAGYQD